MFRSVYARMLVTYLLIIAFILLLQSVLLVQFYRRDYFESAQNIATKQAEQIANMVANPTGDVISDWKARIALIETYLTDSNQVWFVDRDGTVTKATSSDSFQLSAKVIKEDIAQVFEGQRVILENKFQSEFGTPMLSVGVPVIINEQVRQAIFVHTEISAMEGVVYSLYRHIFISAVIAVFVSTFLVLLSSRHISSPLKEMSHMTKEIADGNFDKRISIDADDEIGHLAQSFNNMADNLMKQEELRSSFVANVSHELRSPLTSIHGFAQGMLDGTIDEGNRDKYLQIILDETTRLKKLIRELLDLSQIESGKFPLHLQEFDINEHIRRVLIRYIDRMEDNEIDLEVDFRQERCTVFADSDRIEQVIVNLIDNAIKFTPPHGTISIWTHQTNDSVMVGVGDTGAGIPEEDLPYIFERFYKSDKSHTEKTGTGLGLSIVKRILDQHGKTITVHSALGKGTKFVFYLPAAMTMEE